MFRSSSEKKADQETKILIQEYAKNPINNHKMKDYTHTQHEGNFICWDDITIYLKIENNIIKDYSFDGNCSTITTAAASFLAEIIIGEDIKEILNWNYKTLLDQWFKVSNRRKRAAVIAIQAAQNAIYTHLGQEKRIELEDLIED